MYYIQSTGKMDIEHRLICWEQRPRPYTRNDMLDEKHFPARSLATHRPPCKERTRPAAEKTAARGGTACKASGA